MHTLLRDCPKTESGQRDGYPTHSLGHQLKMEILPEAKGKKIQSALAKRQPASPH